MKKEIIIFDLDGTLTESKQEISKEMWEVIWNLKQKVGIISGASFEQMQKQFPDILVANFQTYVMPQSGNVLFFNGEKIWENSMNWRAKRDALNHIHELYFYYQPILSPTNEMAEDRGSQITFKFLGLNAPIAEKEKFDPDTKRRTMYLQEHPFHSLFAEVRIAGTTSLDYTEKGKNKGTNIQALLDYLNIPKGKAVYFGDKLMPGGNDETVIGVCDTIEVKGSADTLRKLKTIT